MEQLKSKYKSLLDALNTMQNTIEKVPPKNGDWDIILRDSRIKRFEYTIDTLWKYLKEYLSVKHGIEANTPKSVFRECFKANLITEEETTSLIQMIDDRNTTAHRYKEEAADYISSLTPQYYQTMKKIAARLAFS